MKDEFTQSTHRPERNGIDKIVSERLNSLHPMLTIARDESGGTIQYKVSAGGQVILEVKIIDDGLSFPFVFPNDQLAAELSASLMYNALLKPMGIPILPNGAEGAKADEYLEAALMMSNSSGGTFPHYEQQVASGVMLNGIRVFVPDGAQNKVAPKPRRRKPRQNAGTAEKIANVKRIRKQAIRNGVVTIARIVACQQAGVNEETVMKHEPDLWANWEKSDYS